MAPQGILFIVSIVLFVLAVIFIGLAVAIFFLRNIPDVQADLSGKKRAEAVARIASQRPGRDRRKGVARNEPTSGNLADSGRLPQAAKAAAAAQAAVVSAPATSQQRVAVQQAASQPVQPKPSYRVETVDDGQATTVLPEDNQSTTILPEDDFVTSILSEELAAEVAVRAEAVKAAEAAEVVASGAAGVDEGAPSDDDSPTDVLPDDDAATIILPDDDSATEILADDDSATTILRQPADDMPRPLETEQAAAAIAAMEMTESMTADLEDEPAEQLAQSQPEAKAAEPTPGFNVVRKIVLVESTEFVKAG